MDRFAPDTPGAAYLGQALESAHPDQAALALGHRPEGLKKERPLGRTGIDRVAQGAEAGAAAMDGSDDLEEMGQGARHPVEPGDHHLVARPEPGVQRPKDLAVPRCEWLVGGLGLGVAVDQGQVSHVVCAMTGSCLVATRARKRDPTPPSRLSLLLLVFDPRAA